jgi:hypothetical protein
MKANDPMIPEEPASSLTGRARTDALHALRMLSETAESPSGDGEVPPLPVELRDQWQETYGEAVPAPAAPAAVGSREGWFSRLAGIFARPRVAWAGGLAVAAAVVVVLMQSPEITTGPDNGGIITRGGSHGAVAGSAARVIVVAPSDKAAALLAELARAFPARTIERVDAAPAHTETDAIIIDAGARTIRRDGAAAEPIDGDPLAAPAAVIMAIESLDEPEPR